jgi:hypothetical protein
VKDIKPLTFSYRNVTKQQNDARDRQLTERDPHQFGIERRDEVDLESTGNITQDGDRLFSVGGGDDYPGDKSEGNGHERVPNDRDEEERSGLYTNM